MPHTVLEVKKKLNINHIAPKSKENVFHIATLYSTDSDVKRVYPHYTMR